MAKNRQMYNQMLNEQVLRELPSTDINANVSKEPLDISVNTKLVFIVTPRAASV